MWSLLPPVHTIRVLFVNLVNVFQTCVFKACKDTEVKNHLATFVGKCRFVDRIFITPDSKALDEGEDDLAFRVVII